MRQLVMALTVGAVALTAAAQSVGAQSPQLFATETAAQKHCPADNVVWIDTASGIYHLKGMRWYGNTTTGAYVCQQEANAAGYRLPVFCRYCAAPHG